MYDLMIRNARIVDGTGAPWYRADIAVEGGKIAAIENFPARRAKLWMQRIITLRPVSLIFIPTATTASLPARAGGKPHPARRDDGDCRKLRRIRRPCAGGKEGRLAWDGCVSFRR